MLNTAMPREFSFLAVSPPIAKLSGFIEGVDSRLHDLSIDGCRRAAAADPTDTLSFDGNRQAAFDADEPTGTDSESLREHLVIGDFSSVTALLSRSGGGERCAPRFGLRDQRIMRSSVGHALERHQMTAGIDDADADDLLQFLGFLDGRLDDDVAAFVSEF
jgi:hypothetical protein